MPKWIQNKVIPAYTILSVAYCKSLPGIERALADVIIHGVSFLGWSDAAGWARGAGT